ncbi:MAG: dihydropteroate synthase, partial [Lachnospiraceae bacterium]|nr:dihydropteroate synthase [Lachnospiraceae bacterium]
KFNLPILMAASRKSVVGLALDLPVNDRLEGTLAITSLSVIKGCNFVRVHDVKENKRVADMTYKILQYKKE